MIRAEREQLIARYLGGEMKAAEEQEFFIQVALDGELRNDLKAHRIIDDSARNYRDAELRRQHTALRQRTAAMLAVYPMAHQTVPVPAASGLLSRTTAVTRWLLSRPSRWMTTGALAIGIAAGAFLLLPHDDARIPASTLRRTDTTVTSMPATGTLRSPASMPADIRQEDTPSAVVMDHPSSPRSAIPPERGAMEKSARRAEAAPPGGSTPRQQNPGNDSRQQKTEPLPEQHRQKNDSLKIGVDVTIAPVRK